MKLITGGWGWGGRLYYGVVKLEIRKVIEIVEEL